MRESRACTTSFPITTNNLDRVQYLCKMFQFQLRMRAAQLSSVITLSIDSVINSQSAQFALYLYIFNNTRLVKWESIVRSTQALVEAMRALSFLRGWYYCFYSCLVLYVFYFIFRVW